MKSVIHVINRCLVIEFYKQNAAFFGLILLVLFGFIKSSEHIAIGSFLVANPSALLYLYVLWIAYGFKVVLFLIPAMNKKENHFLESYFLLPLWTKIISAFLAAFSFMLPILFYAFFLIVLAIDSAFFISILSLMVALILIVFLMAYFLYLKLNNLPHEKSITTIKFFSSRIKPPYLFFAEHVLRNEIVLFLLSKFYVCIIIIGTSLLYKTDQFDLRLLTTGVLLAFVGNVAIIHKYVWFQHDQMAFAKNRPQSFITLITQQFLTFTILMTPEMIVLLRHYPLEPTILDVVGIILFGFSLTNLLYALLIKKQAELSDFMTVIFWLVVVTTFLILFAVHPIVLGIGYFLMSIVIIHFRYYQFEYLES